MRTILKMKRQPFAKYHGLGNDFVLINALQEPAPGVDGQTAAAWCDRHFGIGADGVILLLPSQQAACRMQLFNTDGSLASSCGNGLRCLALFARDEGIISASSYSVETPAGIVGVQLDIGPHGQVGAIAVHMGQPRLRARDVPTRLAPPDQDVVETPITAGQQAWTVTAMRMGASHCVLFLPALDAIDVHVLGPAFECHPAFPQRINVMFAQVIDHDHLRVIPWERGVGATLACGSGACAASVAGALTGRTGRQVDVTMPGGTLHVCWDKASGQVTLAGPARRVFAGYIEQANSAPSHRRTSKLEGER